MTESTQPYTPPPPAGRHAPRGHAPVSLARTLAAWLLNITVLAIAGSIVLHVAGGIASKHLRVGGSTSLASGGAPTDDVIEMAVLTAAELTSLDSTSVSLDTPPVPDAVPQLAPEIAELMNVGPGESSSGGGSEMGDLGPLAGGGDIGSGEGLGMGGSGGGGSSFFGVEAQGNRFAYIVDVSGSMEGEKLDRLKDELSRSIDGLMETSEFLIVQYADADDVRVIGEVADWQRATPSSKRSIKAHIGLLTTLGTTNPGPAFELLDKKRPRPDAVYFLTDGDFDGNPDEVAEAIIRLTIPWRAPVHTLCFDSESSQQRMRRIAKATRGTYVFLRGPR